MTTGGSVRLLISSTQSSSKNVGFVSESAKLSNPEKSFGLDSDSIAGMMKIVVGREVIVHEILPIVFSGSSWLNF
jgi:hypothetical protein